MSQLLLSSPAPLRTITENLNDMPDRLRLLAECIEGDRTAYMQTVVVLLLECADRLDAQLAHLRSHSYPECPQEARHA